MGKGLIQRANLVGLTTGISTADANTVKTNLGLAAAEQAASVYVSGRSYLACPTGANVTATNTNTLTNDTMYGVVGYINAPVTISGMSSRTSSSNASVGGALKFAIYTLDSSLNPTTRLASSTTGVTVTDLATSTVFGASFSANVTLNPGAYLFTVLPTSGATPVRLCTFTSTAPWVTLTGGANASAALSVQPLVGYTSTGNTYASNPPATFTANSSATAVTAITNLPTMSFVVV